MRVSDNAFILVVDLDNGFDPSMRSRVFRLLSPVLICIFIAARVDVLAGVMANDLKDSDPKKDAARAIEKRIFRFYAVNGVAPDLVVGIDANGKDKDLVDCYGFRTIEGTSDYDGGSANIKASNYAAIYNQAIRDHIRKIQCEYKAKSSNNSP